MTETSPREADNRDEHSDLNDLNEGSTGRFRTHDQTAVEQSEEQLQSESSSHLVEQEKSRHREDVSPHDVSRIMLNVDLKSDARRCWLM